MHNHVATSTLEHTTQYVMYMQIQVLLYQYTLKTYKRTCTFIRKMFKIRSRNVHKTFVCSFFVHFWFNEHSSKVVHKMFKNRWFIRFLFVRLFIFCSFFVRFVFIKRSLNSVNTSCTLFIKCSFFKNVQTSYVHFEKMNTVR